MGKSKIRDCDVFSSCLLGDEAQGELELFSSPRGEPIPQLGQVVGSRLQTDLETNLVQVGELGAGIGDAVIRAVAVHLSGDAEDCLCVVARKLTLDLQVAYQTKVKFGVSAVLDLAEFKPHDSGVLTPLRMPPAQVADLPDGPILVSRTDTISAIIKADHLHLRRPMLLTVRLYCMTSQIL